MICIILVNVDDLLVVGIDLDLVVGIDLDVTQAAFGVGILCNSLSAATPRVLPVGSDAFSSVPTAANGLDSTSDSDIFLSTSMVTFQ